jgi:nucleotide-binding universal stress UspA family protein
MAAIWRVSRADIAMPMIMKVPLLRPGDDPLTIVGYEVESRILPRLSGIRVPNFVAAGGFEQPYIVMELVPGRSLEPRLDGSPLSYDEVATIGARIATALEDIHRQHVVHLDSGGGPERASGDRRGPGPRPRASPPGRARRASGTHGAAPEVAGGDPGGRRPDEPVGSTGGANRLAGPPVMVAIDLAPGQEALAAALRIAVRRILLRTFTQARRTVVKTSRLTVDDLEDTQGRNLHLERLAELERWARPLDRVTYHVFEFPDPAGALLTFARRNGVDHVVMGARGSSTLRRYLGSVSSRVVAEAPARSPS